MKESEPFNFELKEDKSLKGKVMGIYYRIYRVFRFISRIPYNTKHICKNLRWMFPHIIKFRAWDYACNIELFADSLEQLAKEIKRKDIFVGAEKESRRCLYSAKMLRKLYIDDNSIWEIPSIIYTLEAYLDSGKISKEVFSREKRKLLKIRRSTKKR